MELFCAKGTGSDLSYVAGDIGFAHATPLQLYCTCTRIASAERGGCADDVSSSPVDPVDPVDPVAPVHVLQSPGACFQCSVTVLAYSNRYLM